MVAKANSVPAIGDLVINFANGNKANRNAQGGQGKYNSVAIAGVIALNSTPM
jgi:hypothetical protein